MPHIEKVTLLLLFTTIHIFVYCSEYEMHYWWNVCSEIYSRRWICIWPYLWLNESETGLSLNNSITYRKNSKWSGPSLDPTQAGATCSALPFFIILKMSPLLVLFSAHCVCWRLTFSYLTMQWLPLQAIAYWRLRCWQVMSSVKICSKNLYLKHDPFCYLFPVYILWKVSMLKFR